MFELMMSVMRENMPIVCLLLATQSVIDPQKCRTAVRAVRGPGTFPTNEPGVVYDNG
jgi:hypothetical protein